MNKKKQFMDKLIKAMDKHGYRPHPMFITKLEQMPEALFEKALNETESFKKSASPDVNVADENLKDKK